MGVVNFVVNMRRQTGEFDLPTVTEAALNVAVTPSFFIANESSPRSLTYDPRE